MSSLLEKSLDEIIEADRDKKRQNRRQRRRSSNPSTPTGVRKQRKEGRTSTAGGNETQWKHDKFESKEAASQQQQQQAKLIVSNLRDTISSDSLRTLFSQVGHVVSAVLKVDQSGRSLGSAEIIMGSVGDAKDAVSAFNEVNVDNQPIRVTLLKSWTPQGRAPQARSPAPASRTVTKVSSNEGADKKPARAPRRNSNAAGAKKAKEGRREQGEKSKPTKTQEELDRELDDFFGRS